VNGLANAAARDQQHLRIWTVAEGVAGRNGKIHDCSHLRRRHAYGENVVARLAENLIWRSEIYDLDAIEHKDDSLGRCARPMCVRLGFVFFDELHVACGATARAVKFLAVHLAPARRTNVDLRLRSPVLCAGRNGGASSRGTQGSQRERGMFDEVAARSGVHGGSVAGSERHDDTSYAAGSRLFATKADV
jgi:hypothetical protein